MKKTPRLYIGDITMFRNDCGIEGLVLLNDEDIESVKTKNESRSNTIYGDDPNEILIVIDTAEMEGHSWIPCQVCAGFLIFPKDKIEKKRIYQNLEEIESDMVI